MQPSLSILVIGLNYKEAPLELREKFLESVPFERAREAFYPGLINEFVGLTTCNRTELYIVTNSSAQAKRELSQLFDFAYIYVLVDGEATNHLYRVVSGLDSMILGEYDIVAQIKQAYFKAAEAQTVGPILNQLFQRAIRASKVVRSSTNIGTGITSMARAAVDQAKSKVDNLKDQSVLVIGAGDMAQKVGKYLVKEGVIDITFANRTINRGQRLAKECRAKAITLDELPNSLPFSTIVISATAAPSHVVTQMMLENIMTMRPYTPIHIIDLAVPRDIEPSAASIPGVHLYNVDTLQSYLDENKKERMNAVTKAQALIELESQKFWAWHEARRTIPQIAVAV